MHYGSTTRTDLVHGRSGTVCTQSNGYVNDSHHQPRVHRARSDCAITLFDQYDIMWCRLSGSA